MTVLSGNLWSPPLICHAHLSPAGYSRSNQQREALKSADWWVTETKMLLHAWAPHFQKLKSVSNKERIRISKEIYEQFKSQCAESDRTLPQIKKRQQNLEYEYKQLKLRASKTGEEGLNKIKENFPYFNIFEDIMGCRDSVDLNKMQVESSSVIQPPSFPTERPKTPLIDTETEQNDAESSDMPTGAQKKRKGAEQRGSNAKKSRRAESHETDDDQGGDQWRDMWERSIRQDNERFEKYIDLLQENQSQCK